LPGREPHFWGKAHLGTVTGFVGTASRRGQQENSVLISVTDTGMESASDFIRRF